MLALATLATVALGNPSAVQVTLHRRAAHQAAVAKALAARPLPARPQLVEGAAPTIPAQWGATLNIDETINGVPFSSILPIFVNQTMYSDVTLKRSATLSSIHFPLAPASLAGTGKDFMNSTGLATANFSGYVINGETLEASHAGIPFFRDLFQWLPIATDGGAVTVNGTALHAWTYAVPSQNLSLMLLVDAAGTPVMLEENVTVPPPSPYAGALQLRYGFSSFTPGATWAGWAAVVESDFYDPKPCPLPAGSSTDPPPVELDMFIFHPANEFNITRQDVGDARGDVFFTCVDVLTGQNTSIDHDYAWITAWRVTAVPRWGQYQNCNGYNPPSCLGASDFYVGHEAAQGLGLPTGGQCTVNPDTGEWWSLPAGGHCAEGEEPGGGKCTWKAVRTKTIDSKCLFTQQGFAAACRKEQRAPFEEATALFLKGFAEDDPSKGGCPALPGPARAAKPAAATPAAA